MQNFRQLEVYQDAYKLSKDVYEEIKSTNNFRLKHQLFGSVTSIPANLAEMGAFGSKRACRHKISICIGEANETEFWLDFCRDTCQISEKHYADYIRRITSIRRRLFGLLKSIKDNQE